MLKFLLVQLKNKNKYYSDVRSAKESKNYKF